MVVDEISFRFESTNPKSKIETGSAGRTSTNLYANLQQYPLTISRSRLWNMKRLSLNSATGIDPQGHMKQRKIPYMLSDTHITEILDQVCDNR